MKPKKRKQRKPRKPNKNAWQRSWMDFIEYSEKYNSKTYFRIAKECYEYLGRWVEWMESCKK